MVNKIVSQANLSIYWVKAHVGQKFNERADELAKAGLQAPRGKHVGISNQRLKLRYKDRMRELWEEEWLEDKRFRQTKVWFPGRNPRNSRELLKFGRCKLGTMVQWITGFCNLMKHRHRKHSYIDPRCRRCDEDKDETPLHLTWECDALGSARVNNLNIWGKNVLNPLLDPGQVLKWRPEQLHKFIIESNSEVLLVDNEDYQDDSQ